MAIGIWYWLILALLILFNGFAFWSPQIQPYSWCGNWVLLVLLFVLIGIRVMGSPVQ